MVSREEDREVWPLASGGLRPRARARGSAWERAAIMGSRIMGTFRYPIVDFGPNWRREREIQTLVDTGAAYIWIPRPIPEGSGHRPVFKQRLRSRLATSSAVRSWGSTARAVQRSLSSAIQIWKPFWLSWPWSSSPLAPNPV